MSDLPPGFVLDQPVTAADTGLPPGFVLDNPGSSIGGVAKSLGTGLAEGAIGLAGLPGDLYHLGLRALGDNLTPESAYGSNAIKKSVEGVTGEFYKPQGAAEDIASKIGQFAPAVIGGPETMAAKLATRVAAPALASEAGGAVAGPYGEIAGALLGAGGASVAASKLNAMRAARLAPDLTSAEIKAASRAGYQHPDVQAVQIKPEVLSGLADKIESDLQYGPNSGFRPANEKRVFDAVNELRTPAAGGVAPSGGVAPQGFAATAPKAAAVAAVAPAPPAAPKAQSLLEFIASKGGLGPDAELAAIGGEGHTVNVEGVGRRKLVRQGGWPLDYAREAAEEAGYLRGGHAGTSTVNDLLDAIDAEMRGQKRYPEGFEGYVNKRGTVAMSERERAEYDRHMQGFKDDLNDAGHGGLAPDVKRRAMDLMAKERIHPDDAVERALLQLEQEDAARPVGNAAAKGNFPGDLKPPASAQGRPATIADLDNVRQVLGNAAKEKDAIGQPTRQAAAASRAIGHIDSFLPSLKQPDLLAGDAAKANNILERARGDWAAYKKSSQVQTLLANAQLNAASANSGGNIQNATKQAFKPLLKNNSAKVASWSDDEKAALNKIVRGTWTGSAARMAGNLLGGGGGLGMLAGGAAGYEAGGLPGAIAAGAAGRGLKMIGNRSTFNAVQKLDTLIRSRSPEALKIAAQNPQLAAVLPPKSIRLLRTMILAEPILHDKNQQRQSVGYANP